MSSAFIQPGYDPLYDFFSQKEQGDPNATQNSTEADLELNTLVSSLVSPSGKWVYFHLVICNSVFAFTSEWESWANGRHTGSYNKYTGTIYCRLYR